MSNEIIGKITAVRAKNNELWMKLLDLAFRYAPGEAKEIMRKIVENDKQIDAHCLELGEK